MRIEILTQERLKQMLFYNLDTGIFTRIKTQNWNAKIGSIAGCIGNRTGYKGVKKNGSGYIARIMISGIQVNLGTYPTPEMAHSVYQKEAQLHFKEFYRSP